MLLALVRTAGVALVLNLSTAAWSQSPPPLPYAPPPIPYPSIPQPEELPPHAPPASPPAPGTSGIVYPTIYTTPYTSPLPPKNQSSEPDLPLATYPPGIQPLIHTVQVPSLEPVTERELPPVVQLEEKKFQALTQGKHTVEVNVGSVKLLQLESSVDRYKVWDPNLVEGTMSKDRLSPEQDESKSPYLVVYGKEPGVTSATVIDKDQKHYEVTIIVQPDTRELRYYLKKLYPNANLQLTVLKSAVVVRGTVQNHDQSQQVCDIAGLYFPQVFNQLTVRHPLPPQTIPPVQQSSWTLPADIQYFPLVPHSLPTLVAPSTIHRQPCSPPKPSVQPRSTMGSFIKPGTAAVRVHHGVLGSGGLSPRPTPVQVILPIGKYHGPYVINTYPVADLVVPFPKVVTFRVHSSDCPAQPSCPEQNICPTVESCPQNKTEKPAVTFEPLIQRIQSEVAPEYWSGPHCEGKIAANEKNLSLVVSAPLGMHVGIEKLLNQMRRDQDFQVALEIRQLSIPEEVWQQLKLNADPQTGSILLNPREMRMMMTMVQHNRQSSVHLAPKVTLFSGQIVQLFGLTNPAENSSSHLYRVNVSPDRRMVHFQYSSNSFNPLAFFQNLKVASIPDGHTIVMVAAEPELQEASNPQATPVLNKVPYVSRLFKNTGVGRVESRLVTLITPTILVLEEEEEVSVQYFGGLIKRSAR